MAKHKSRSGEWHHRIPDFELVYCGPETLGETGKKRSHRPARALKAGGWKGSGRAKRL